MDSPKILRSELYTKLKKIKRHKATGPDEIVTEMLTSLEEYGVSKVTDIINEIYDTGEITEDLCSSISIGLPKKPGAVECELNRTISMMSHIIKLILRIIMEKACSRIRLEIGIEQCGFVEDTGIRNAIFMVRMISERAIVYMCFTDYIKSFDTKLKVQIQGIFIIKGCTYSKICPNFSHILQHSHRCFYKPK